MPKRSKKNQKKIKEAVIKVIVFFDMFDFPLTSFEIWQNLDMSCSFAELFFFLEAMDKKINYQKGFYFLRGREKIIKKRLRRYNYSERKMKRAKRIASLFKYIPWIVLIAVGNIMGNHNLRDNSDIDFFIVTKKKRLWLSRFVCVSIIKFLNLRPRVNNTRDKICLSFYISEDSFQLKKLHLVQKEDIYFFYWLSGLKPIFDSGGKYDKLLQDNEWLLKKLSNWQKKTKVLLPTNFLGSGFFYRDVWELFFGGLERVVRSWQLRLLPNDLRKIMNIDTRVVINDRVLKLHAKDRREKYVRLYKKKLLSLGIRL